MPRTHPPTLITLARAALRTHGLVPRGSSVLAAVSGGPDSMALLHVLALLRQRLGFGVFAHGVDHGLRLEAAAELDLAERFARSLDVPFSRTRIAVSTGGNLQARARTARWEALRTAASRARVDRIATGHHADDRAETLGMRMLRGTGLRGLAVLPPLDVVEGSVRIRPFFRALRTDVDAHVARHRVPFVSDPSNRDPRFLRSRVRYEVLPQLRRLSPRIVEHLGRLADDAAVTGKEPISPGASSASEGNGGVEAT
jgi:tRNA(Ile)-lysidine synthase